MVEIQPGFFKIGDVEDMHLSGTYDLKLIFNKNVIARDAERNIDHQEIYDVGKVLFRTDTENIDELIDLFIRYTYEPCAEIDLDFSVAQRTGSIYCTSKIIFAYRRKVFVAEGRYMFCSKMYGCEIITRVPVEVEYNDESEVEDSEDEMNDESEVNSDWSGFSADSYHESDCCEGCYSDKDSLYEHNRRHEREKMLLPDLLSNKKIQMRAPLIKDRRTDRNDHYNSFMIYDQETLVVDVFGIYL